KDHSRNNCDLITDFEWTGVIHKQLTAKGFKNYDPKVWHNCYQTYVHKYVEALNRYDSICSAKDNFVYFEEFNEMYFNHRNPAFIAVMNARSKFLLAFLRRWRHEDTSNTMPDTEDISKLKRTVTRQQKLIDLRKETIVFHKKLENNVPKIKVFNLIVQAIAALKGHLSEPGLYVKISRILADSGLDWNHDDCEQALKEWIVFYDENYYNYKNAMKADNRVVEYIYEFLNIITTVRLDTIFYSNQKITDCLESIARHTGKSTPRCQRRLKINDKNIDKILEAVRTEQQLNSFKNSDDIQIIAVLPAKKPNTSNESSVTSKAKTTSGSSITGKSTKTSPKTPKAETTKTRDSSQKSSSSKKSSSSSTKSDDKKSLKVPKREHRDSFKVSSPESWRLDYRHYTIVYLKTLNDCKSVDSAQKAFPLFKDLNNNYFNSNNALYKDIMTAREEFAKRLPKFKSEAEEELIRTIQNQSYNADLHDHRLRCFQSDLESRIDEIKCVNLMVQIIDLIQRNNKIVESGDIFQKVSEVMSVTGFLVGKQLSPAQSSQWRPYQCEETLRYWTIYYNQHLELYESALTNRHKIVKYVFDYLNIIPEFLTNEINVRNSYLFSDTDSAEEHKLTEALVTIRTLTHKHTVNRLYICAKVSNEIKLKCDDTYRLDTDYRGIDSSFNSTDYYNTYDHKRPNAGPAADHKKLNLPIKNYSGHMNNV
ncbi:unnamed protein product, partial [Medioppia subpectinata]